jgi:hypothetical protein
MIFVATKNLASAPEIDDNRSATNSPDTFTAVLGYLVTKLYVMQTSVVYDPPS